MKFSNFLKEGTEESFGRLSSAALIATAILIAIMEVNWKLFNPNFIIDTPLIIELALVGMGVKVWGKYAEKKEKK